MKIKKSRLYHVGVDDTDSSEGMCTTFLCYYAVKHLLKTGKIELVDYPHLIRLNPNIPWKTRGNAALSVQIITAVPRDRLFRYFENIVRRFATSPRANSGLVMIEGRDIPQEIQDFSRRALYSVMSLREARKIVSKFDMESLELRSGQGLVGAIASIGNLLKKDHTFELIAYRRNNRLKRFIEPEKVVRMSEARFPETFSSYDQVYGRVMISPHGPDPVLCGIRGETAKAVREAFLDLRPVKNLGGFMTFRSNQATGEHLSNALDLETPGVYTSGTVTGTVSSAPRIEMGGHVFFNVRNTQGEIACASYEPTADFRNAVRELVRGDEVEVSGGIRKPTSAHPRVLNLEALRPLKLQQVSKFSNPKCSNCGVSMKSMGRGQDFECDKCGERTARGKKSAKTKRSVTTQLYIPPLKAHRHLTKPLHRYSLPPKEFELPAAFIEDWYQ